MAIRVSVLVGFVACASAVRAQDKPPTKWKPAYAGNYTSASVGRGIQYVVLHTIEGTAGGAIGWFKNPSSNVSAHYVVDYDGSITQMLQDKDIAWHAGHGFYNKHSIAIDHAGYAKKNYWTPAMYQQSAALTRWICLTYGIPMTRQRILGHNEVPDPDGTGFGGSGNHTDPGPFFNWEYYLSLVTSGPTTIPASYQAMEVTSWRLNVRTGPSTAHAVIGSIPHGHRYVSEETSGGWRKIWFANNTGWSYGGYLAKKSGMTGARILADTLDVRSGPGSGYPSVGLVSYGQRYVQAATLGNWRQVYWGGKLRWIPADFTILFGM